MLQTQVEILLLLCLPIRPRHNVRHLGALLDAEEQVAANPILLELAGLRVESLHDPLQRPHHVGAGRGTAT